MSVSKLSLTIDLDVICANYKGLAGLLAPGIDIAAVVKANAYGLGASKIVPALSKAGCHMFFVATLEEAMIIREATLSDRIYVLNGIAPGEEKYFFSGSISPVLNTIEQIELWKNFCLRKRKKLAAIIHVDTGMNRLGLNYESGVNFLQENITELNEIFELTMIMSHFVCSEDVTNAKNHEQYLQVKHMADIFPGIKISLCNSGGIFLSDNYHFDVVRPGAILYGYNVSGKKLDFIKNPMHLTSKILQVREVEKDGTVGYDGTAKVKKGMMLATIAGGYADGYVRAFSNKAFCHIADIKVPVIGNVSMDLTILDVTNVPKKELYLGAEVEIIGKNCDIAEMAHGAGMTGYELLRMSDGLRCKKEYIGG